MTTTAIILSGGRSRRFGGIHKPGVDLDGRTVLSRILGTVREGLPGAEVWVAGRTDGLSPSEVESVHVVLEEPRFSGPLAAIAAAIDAAGASDPAVDAAAGASAAGDFTFVVAGDMPLVEAEHVRALAAECRTSGRPASGTDDRGKLQFLCTAWPTEVLRARLTDIGDPADRPVKLLFAGIDVSLVPVDPTTLLDFDTPEEFERVSGVRVHGRQRKAEADAEVVTEAGAEVDREAEAEEGAGSGTAEAATAPEKKPVPPELFAARDAAVRELGLDPESLGDAEVVAVLDFASRVKHSDSRLSPVLAAYLAGLVHSADSIGVDDALARVEEAIGRRSQERG